MIYYLFQTIVYAGLLWLLYVVFLRNKPMHGFNRFFLLVAAVIPFVLPYIRMDLFFTENKFMEKYLSFTLPEVVVGEGNTETETIPLILWVVGIYALVSMCIISYNVYRYIVLRTIIRRSEKITTDNYTLLINTGYGPGSWGKFIFLPEATTDSRIIAHEYAHISLKHSLDNMLLMLLQICFWYNPFLQVIKKELKQVHEFEADAAVQSDKTSYQELLFNHFLTKCQLPFTHSFINHPIKRRIMMLNKSMNNNAKRWRMVLMSCFILVLTTSIVWFQSCTAQNGKESDEYVMKKDSVFSYVHKMPELQVDIIEFISENLEYPEEAKKKNIEGRVTIRFIVNREGEVVNEQVLSSPDPLLTKAALEVVRKLPKWKPGEDGKGDKVNVYFQQSINFKMDDKKQGSLNSPIKDNNASDDEIGFASAIDNLAVDMDKQAAQLDRQAAMLDKQALQLEKQAKRLEKETLKAEKEAKAFLSSQDFRRMYEREQQYNMDKANSITNPFQNRAHNKEGC